MLAAVMPGTEGEGRRAVFLDRDGVINRAVVRDGRPYPPERVEQFEILPGVEEALTALRKAGYLLIVVTNQPDVGRGSQSREVVECMHARIRAVLPIDDIKVCWAASEDQSPFYKPRPGMLLEAAQEYNIDLRRSFMVGDRWRDVGAGSAAGAFTIFIDYGYQERRPVSPDHVVGSLAEAAEWIQRKTQERQQT